MNEKLISYLKKYIISFALMGIVTLFVLWIREHSQVTDLATIYLNLADAFTIPGVIMLMVGLLAWVSTQGGFDMISYGVKRGITSIIPGIGKSDERFYDYKTRMEQKRIKGYSFLFISGGIYLIPAIVFNVLYYTL